MKFARLTETQKLYLLNAEFDEMIITHTEIKEVGQVFGLEDMEREEMQAVRNGVVRFLSDERKKREEAAEANDFSGLFSESARRLWTNMSAVTCAIDHFMF